MTVLMLKDKNIVVLGAGLTGLSCARFLHANNIAFAVNDSREQPVDVTDFTKQFPDTQLVLGRWDKSLIANADLLLVSPGIDLNKIPKNRKIDCQTWGDVELFCRLSSVPIVAVTGSNGKSTVVSLLTHIGQKLGKNVQLGGNVGVPVLDHLTASIPEQNSPNIELLVLELSSFQLETMTSMQALAATVLNISDDHLDRHLTMDNYQQIKQSIYLQCKTAIFNRDDLLTVVNTELAHELPDKLPYKLPLKSAPEHITSFGSDKPISGQFGIAIVDKKTTLMFGEQALIQLDQLPLAGIHNALNFLAALALGYAAGWSLPDMVKHLSSFEGLAHRCQRIFEQSGSGSVKNNITWINDSKATNVGATLAAINGLAQTLIPEQKLILIAGGDGKGADFSPLKSPVAQYVHQLITLGKDGDEIAELDENTIRVDSLEEAVITAKRVAKSGDVVLLSPACASLDMFKNFAARGQAFVDAIQNTRNLKSSEKIKEGVNESSISKHA
jgi:UDP-N-acetylmuramoylalanine--D-glutamate ligase